jgi:hypothetical protein
MQNIEDIVVVHKWKAKYFGFIQYFGVNCLLLDIVFAK